MAAIPMRAVFDRDEPRILVFPRCPTVERLAASRELTASQRLDLDRLRWLALRSQLAPKPDLERACYLLAGEPAVSLERYAIAFFRGLCGNASGEMVMYRPGAKAVSDDELWLVRLVDAWRSGEDKLASALVSWRVRSGAQRWIRFLSARMVDALDDSVPV